MESAERTNRHSVGTYTLDPSEIIVADNLDRFRQDMGELEELAYSIQKYGQLQPIVTNRNLELLAGGRRLAACKLYNIKVLVRVIDETNSLRMREIEVEENIQRKDFTPAERVLAVRELHELKCAVEEQAGKTWAQEDTAKFLKTSRSNICTDLQTASFIDAFPELLKCKSRKELASSVKALSVLVDRATGFEQMQVNTANSERCFLHNMEAYDFLRTFEENTVDIILCDPPYGISISDVTIGKGGKTGAEINDQHFKFVDSEADMYSICHHIAHEGYKITKDTAHLYMFIAPEYFSKIRSLLIEAGWEPHVRPLIWVKQAQGQANMPYRWPVTTYEMCVYARKSSTALIQARSDVLTYNRVPPAQKIHPTQKPIDLLQDLITRSVKPGSVLIDPCMGSGSSLVAGLREGLIVHGCDKEYAAYTAAIQYVNFELGE